MSINVYNCRKLPPQSGSSGIDKQLCLISWSFCTIERRSVKSELYVLYFIYPRYIKTCFAILSSVKLGSIKELPAFSCQEIKESEGDYYLSGYYWLKPDNSSKTLPSYVYCAMPSRGEIFQTVVFSYKSLSLNAVTSWRETYTYRM